MPYITFVVPCYNSQDYMRRCVNSLLPGGKDVEIIIVDDGSGDRTGEIADTYQALYPDTVRTVHKPNGGHGSGINVGLKLARGLYFKVVDSDDWLDAEAYRGLLDYLKELQTKQREEGLKEQGKGQRKGSKGQGKGLKGQGKGSGEEGQPLPDLIVSNYVYDHLEEGVQKPIRYRNVFPRRQICTWKEIKGFLPSQYLVMHAQIFRTELLRQAKVELPEHTFYVDNLFSCVPLPLVERLVYLDLDLYHYYLGREDQSVNEKVMISRIHQLIRVTNLAADAVDLEKLEEKEPKLADYLRRNISIMMAMTSIHLLLMRSPEGIRERKELWEGLQKRNPRLYRHLRYRTLSGWTYLPGWLGREIALWGYRLAKKFIKFQ